MSDIPQLKINFIKIAPLLVLLAALSLWPSMVVDSSFVAVPIISFLLLLAVMVIFKKANAVVFELVPKLGFLYVVLILLSVTLLSASLLLISYEAVYIDNTLNGVSMLRIALIIGAPIGVMTWVPLSKRLGYKNIFMLKSFLISFALVAATIASQINRGFDDGEQKQVVRSVIEKKKNRGGLTSYLTQRAPLSYIYIPYDESIERLSVPTSVWDTMYQNATIRLAAKTGYFGYDYVVRFNDRAL